MRVAPRARFGRRRPPTRRHAALTSSPSRWAPAIRRCALPTSLGHLRALDVRSNRNKCRPSRNWSPCCSARSPRQRSAVPLRRAEITQREAHVVAIHGDHRVPARQRTGPPRTRHRPARGRIPSRHGTGSTRRAPVLRSCTGRCAPAVAASGVPKTMTPCCLAGPTRRSASGNTSNRNTCCPIKNMSPLPSSTGSRSRMYAAVGAVEVPSTNVSPLRSRRA